MDEKKRYCGHIDRDCLWPDCYCAEGEVDRLRAELQKIVEIDHYPDATIARKALGINS